jgi:hypothetical protein
VTAGNGQVYCLKCPKTGKVRYVGQSKDPIRRYCQHVKRSHLQEIRHWIDGLNAEGMMPILEIMKDATSELDEINRYLFEGHDLANVNIFEEKSSVSYCLTKEARRIVASEAKRLGTNHTKAMEILLREIRELRKSGSRP